MKPLYRQVRISLVKDALRSDIILLSSLVAVSRNISFSNKHVACFKPSLLLSSVDRASCTADLRIMALSSNEENGAGALIVGDIGNQDNRLFRY